MGTASMTHSARPWTPAVDAFNRISRRVPPWTLYVLGAAYAGYLFYLGVIGAWVEPITELEHRYGEFALQMIVLGLAVTPLRQYLKINLMPFRRAIGVLAFFFVLAHLLVWALLDVQRVSLMWADILERPYITIGMLGFLLLLPLGLTSNNFSVRKLGAAAWRKVHKLVYPAAILGAVHYVMLAKGFQIEPLIYLFAIAGLVGLRSFGGRAKRA